MLIYMWIVLVWLRGVTMCDHVLLRLVITAERTFLDLRGMAYLNFSTKQLTLLRDPSVS